MIDFVTSNDRQGYGIEMVLQSDRIPYQRIDSAREASGRLLLIATWAIGDDLAELARRVPTLIIGELPEQLTDLFDHSAPQKMLRNGCCVWYRAPLGERLTNLLSEDYACHPKQHAAPGWLHALSCRLSEWMSRFVPRGIARKLQQKLTRRQEPSGYPLDRSGWVLMELLRTMIRHEAGGLVRIERWPAPYRAAATLTHDVEPSKYSYTQGLDELRRVASETGHPSSFGLVSSQARRYLNRYKLEDMPIYCHGREHRRETVSGSKEDIANAIGTAKSEIEELAGRAINGFRSPHLDRSAEMYEALDESGFTYSSSAPDVDSESPARYGGGVRLNLPFRPPLLRNDASCRASRCLELPVSAPDCIQPLFGGETVGELRQAVRDKIEFVAETGGLYVGIVHAAVFGSNEAKQRMNHLRFVAGELDRSDLWLASMDDIAAWWCKREQVHLVPDGEGWMVENRGTGCVRGLRVVAEDAEGNVVYSAELPPIHSGATASIRPEKSFKNGVNDHVEASIRC